MLVTPRSCPPWLLAAGMCILASPASAQNESVNWRIWTTADGMNESFTANVNGTSAGTIIVRHGDVPSLNLLNGYGVASVPDPHTAGRVYAGVKDQFYTFDSKGLRTYDGKKWLLSPIPEFGTIAAKRTFNHFHWYDYPTATGLERDDRVAAIPFGPGKVIVMLPGELFEWITATGERKVLRRAKETSLGTFLDLQDAGGGKIWISGTYGLAALMESGGQYQWAEYPAPPMGSTRLTFPDAGPDNHLLVAARGARGNSILGSQANGWKTLYTNDGKPLRAWHGGEGQVWIADGDRLLALKGKELARVRLPSSVSGRVYDVLPQPGGVFWVATSQALVRYAPALWQTPGGAPEFDTVNAIAEQADGHLWFASGSLVTSLKEGVWQTFGLPPGESQDVSKTESICSIETGKVIVVTGNSNHLLELDPAAGSFRAIKPPTGRYFGWTQRRDERSMWTVTTNLGDRVSRLEVFDGKSFQPVPDMGTIPVTDVRSILKAADGAIWIGGTGGLAVFRDKRFNLIATQEGLPETAVFGMLQGADGTIYLGQRDTVTAFDGKRFRTLQKGVDRARSFAVSPDGTIWIGSGTGVHRLVHGEWITNASEEGLPSQSVYKVMVDRTGTVWAGTTLGLSVFHPDADRDRPTASIQDQRNLRKTPPGGEVRLTFSGQDRWKQTPDHRLLFSWTLDGGSPSLFTEDSFAALKSLPAGGHIFSVRAMDRNGNISVKPALFQFSVLSPWYREKGFYAVAFLLAIAVLLLIRMGLKYHAHLKFESRHDPLTGLPNRAGLEEGLARILNKQHTADRPVAVMFLDLDGFKQVNDSFGHSVGDTLLGEISARIKRHMGPADLVARLGGDEFAIILANLESRQQVAAIAATLLHSVRDCSAIGTNPIRVSASIGASLFPDHSHDAKTLLRLADSAMYRSKSHQGDCFEIYDPSMAGAESNSSEIAHSVRSAQAEGRLRLVYQPIIDRKGSIAQMEALVRMDDKVIGTVPPDQFIGIAEKTGVIHEMGMWIVREACSQARAWREQGFCIPIAVNVSPVQLDAADFADQLLGCLETAGLPTSAIAVEITESALARDPNRAERSLQDLRAAGVMVSLDDFGTGYSSLSILHRLPVDAIKIDRSFLAEMLTNSRTLDVMSQTLHLAGKLGLQTVAEGIEEPSQMEMARELGCDFFQGFLIAKPMEPWKATAFLATYSPAGDLVSA